MIDQQGAIQTILADIDQVLEERLTESGVVALAHVIVAIGPDGHALVHGNIDLLRLKALAQELAELVDASLAIRRDDAIDDNALPSPAKPIH